MRMILGTLIFVCGLVGTFMSSWFSLAGFGALDPAVVRALGLVMAWIGLFLCSSPDRRDVRDDDEAHARLAASRRRRALQSVSAGTVIWLLPFGVSLLTFDSMLGLLPVGASAAIIILAGR